MLLLFKRKSKKVEAVLPDLYLHGLAEGDFDLAMRGLLGGDAPLSASSIARLKQKWQSAAADRLGRARSLQAQDRVRLG